MSIYADGAGHSGRSRFLQAAVLAVKLIVTILCFWYLARTIDWHDVVRAARTLDLRWTAAATLVLMLEIPLIALRWGRIIDALDRDHEPIRRGPIIAIAAIANFFVQVAPNIAADAFRTWMLVQLGREWRRAIFSVVIDRAVGIAALVAIGFVVLQFPSALALGGYRTTVMEMFGALLVAGGFALIFAPPLSALLERGRYIAWLGALTKTAHGVLVGRQADSGIMPYAFAVHGLTIVAIWLLGQAAGFSFPVADAAVLFVVILAVAMIPVSIGGWGVRELAVTSLLAGHNVPSDRALLFSVCFGLVLLIAVLPGALVWTVYSPSRQTR